MDIRAQVREVRGDCARLVCAPAARCGSCGEVGGCGARLFGTRRVRCLDLPLSAERLGTLAPGDPVVLSVAEGALLRAVAIACLLPVTGLLAGAALARWLGAGEALAPFAAAAGACVSVWMGRRLGAGSRSTLLMDAAHPTGHDG